MTIISITINAETPDDITRVAAALGLIGGETNVSRAALGEAKTVTKAPKAAAPAKPAPEKEPEPTAEPETEEPKADDNAVTFDTVKAVATAYSAKNGRDALAALIKDHGGTAGISSIPEQNWADFITQAEG